MGAVQEVIVSALPPVRRPVPFLRGALNKRYAMERFFEQRSVTFYASGTAALAEAIRDCATRTSVASPEVILPAYGCPDLVAACIHASVYPRLVDVAPSLWAYDAASLMSSLSSNTVAIIAVNLLGIGDGSADLLPLCRERGIRLIQDSAQFLSREPIEWPGDYVILSFGRGKPLNLLHGGALISPRGSPGMPSSKPARYNARDALLDSRAAAFSFNVLTHPCGYRLFSLLPGTGLGRVTYRPLQSTAQLPERAGERVGAAFQLYRQRPSYWREIWEETLEEWSADGILALRSPGSPLQPEPLRLALLAPDPYSRNSLVEGFNRAGLGASRMYGTNLTAVSDIPEIVKHQGSFPNATDLADRLFTLPTHLQVTLKTVHTAENIVSRWSKARR